MVAIGLSHQPGTWRPGDEPNVLSTVHSQKFARIAPADGLVHYLNVQWLHLRLPNE